MDLKQLIEERIDELERVSIKDVLQQYEVDLTAEEQPVKGVQELEEIAQKIEGMDIPNNPKQALLSEINAAILSKTLKIQVKKVGYAEFGAIVRLHLLPEKLKLYDMNYFCVDKQTIGTILQASRSRYMQYTADAFDCDDFAKYNSNYATANFGINSVGQLDVALLGIKGFDVKLLGLHACNCPVFSDGTLEIYEGELGVFVPGGVLEIKGVKVVYVPLQAYYY